MPELNSAIPDPSLSGLEQLLTLEFKSIALQLLADFPESRSTAIASAATTDLGTVASGYVHVTGNTTITSLGTAQAGARKRIAFDGALTLTHNATSLILPTGANITTAANDVAVFVSEGAGNWRCVAYSRASGQPLVAGSDRASVSALSTASGVVNVNCALGDYFTLSLSANVTSITFSNLPAAGRGVSIMIRIRQDATGGRTVALPSSFKAISGSDTAVQSSANAYTILSLTSFDQGTRWEYSMKAGAP